MRIAYPFAWSLLIILLFFCSFLRWAQKRRRQDLARFAAQNILPKLLVDSRDQLRRRQHWLRFTVLVLLIGALLGPEWGYTWEEVTQQGIELIIALDTSKSMLATDLKPNRLERAKLAVMDLVKRLPGDKVGLVAFSGTSFLHCPLTFDYNAFGIALAALTHETLPRGGTAIGEAIKTARRAFQNGAAGEKTLIIITDGENHEGDPVSEAQKAADEGITIYTIGLGSPQGELILLRDEAGNISYLKDRDGKVVKSALNEDLLRRIAAAGGGEYLRGTGVSLGLEELYEKRLARQVKTELSSRRQKRYLNRYQLPLLLACLFLTAELLSGARQQEAVVIRKLLRRRESEAKDEKEH